MCQDPIAPLRYGVVRSIRSAEPRNNHILTSAKLMILITNRRIMKVWEDNGGFGR